MLLALVATWKGPGLSNDSVTYLSAGVNIAGSHGMTRLDERPLTVFPPGLPVLAAVGEAVGLGVESTARFLSVVSFGAMVVLGNVLLRRVLRDRRAVLASTALLALSPALLAVFDMAWSEPPFIVVSLVFLLVLCRVWERRAVNGVDLVSLAVLCWLGFLLRYVGASLIIVGAVTLVLALRPLDRRALGRIFVFGALAVSVPIGWMLRNHAADGTYLGPRSPSPDSLWDVAVRTAAVIGQWIVVWPDLSRGAFALVGLTAVALIAAALARIEWPRERPAAAVLACCCIFIPIYVGWLTISSLTTAINPTSSRFLSPIFVPLVVVGSGAAARLIARTDRVLWRNALVGVVAVCLIGFTFVSVRDARDGAADGLFLNSDAVVDGDAPVRGSQNRRCITGSRALQQQPERALVGYRHAADLLRAAGPRRPWSQGLGTTRSVRGAGCVHVDAVVSRLLPRDGRQLPRAPRDPGRGGCPTGRGHGQRRPVPGLGQAGRDMLVRKCPRRPRAVNRRRGPDRPPLHCPTGLATAGSTSSPALSHGRSVSRGMPPAGALRRRLRTTVGRGVNRSWTRPSSP